FLAPLPGEQVLDACAAPGGKSTHLAQLMANSGRITACDVEAKKLRFIAESSARLGISIVETMTLDASQPRQTLGERRFDRILVDAPCSGLGVIRRNPEGKWWKSVYDVARLAALQKTILTGLAASLNKGGTLLYSTCSTTQAENEAVIDDFLSQHPDFVVEDLRILFPEYTELFTERGFFRSWPHRHGMDGFFAARLRKN
ncbi:MAG TPA: methyltransferase domain-containing protein, partial [Geobacteraceae bacterium]|nr:methyltransferase domain-containing protein [Geobacteraceae bacterium]